jgi:hypothetical protein
MTKRRRRTIVLGSVLAGVALLSGLASLTNGFQDFTEEGVAGAIDASGKLAIEEVKNIRFKTLREEVLPDGTVEKTISYTLTPSDSTATDFGYVTDWVKTASADDESATWADGKKTSDYLSYQSDTAAKTLTFHCLSAFGKPILFTMVSNDNPNVSATLRIDYVRKVIQAATATIADTTIKDQSPITVSATKGTYSIGTKGTRASALDPQMNTSYKEVSGATFDSLFGTVRTTGIYAQSYHYKGTSYSDPTLLRATMKTNVYDYLTSLPTFDGSKTMDVASFKALLSYDYDAYHTYEDVFLTDTALYSSFVTSYGTQYAKGAGLQVQVTWNSLTLYTGLLALSIPSSTVTGLSLGDGTIEF